MPKYSFFLTGLCLVCLMTLPAGADEIPASLANYFKLALQNNVDIEVQKPLLDITQADLDVAQSIYEDYFLVSSLFYEDSDLEFLRTREGDINLGVAKRFLSGTEVSLNYGLSYRKTELNIDGLDVLENALGVELENFSFWTSAATLQVSQPLLRNFGVDVNSTQINLARKQRKIADYKIAQQVNNTLAQVESAYWTWVSLLKIRATLQKSIARAEYYKEKFVDPKVGLLEGVLPSDRDQAIVDINRRRELLIQNERQIKVWEDRLRRLIYPFDGNNPDIASKELPPAEDALQGFSVPIEDSQRVPNRDFQKALQCRPELMQIKEQIASADIVIRLRENELLPALDFTGSFSFVGDEEGTNVALRKTFDTDHYNWKVGVEFEYPLGNLAAKGQLRKAEAQKVQIKAIERQAQYDVCLQVQESHHALTEAVKRYDNVSDSLRRTEERLASVERRYVNPLPGDFNLIFFVQDAEFQRTQSQISQFEAILLYKTSMATFKQAHAQYVQDFYPKYRR